MPIYPERIAELSRSPEYCGIYKRQNAVGRSASLVCGSYLQFEFKIDPIARSINAVRYTTNGCGFAIAAAETIAENFHRSSLRELHGADSIMDVVTGLLGIAPVERIQCFEIAVDAFRAALVDHRKRTIEEFRGEKPLVCTCFGISEDMVADLIEANSFWEVAEVTDVCNAGSGCGSCRMLIQEMIDSR